jgi:hypothetical protein
MSVNEKMTTITDAIRDKTGSTEKLGLDEMAEAIPEVYDAGKQAQYDKFWNSYMNNLNGSWAQKGAFAGSGWNDNTFNPNKSYNPWSGKICEMFFKDSRISDLAGILKRNGIVFNFSGCIYFDSFAQSSTIAYFPALDMSSAERFQYTFTSCANMVSIEKWIISSKGNQVFTDTFGGCTSLKNIVIEGVIGNSISFYASPLSKESITSVVNALSTTATGKTLTLKKSAVTKAFETSDGAADGSTSNEWTTFLGTKTNWTISLV